MTTIVVSIVVVAVLLVFVPALNACSCAIPDFPEAFKQANAVFVGEVIGIVKPKT